MCTLALATCMMIDDWFCASLAESPGFVVRVANTTLVTRTGLLSTWPRRHYRSVDSKNLAPRRDPSLPTSSGWRSFLSPIASRMKKGTSVSECYWCDCVQHVA